MSASAVLLESSDINVRGAGLGVIGGIVFTAIVVAVILLVRNMNMRIKRLPDSFDEPQQPAVPSDDSDARSSDGA